MLLDDNSHHGQWSGKSEVTVQHLATSGLSSCPNQAKVFTFVSHEKLYLPIQADQASGKSTGEGETSDQLAMLFLVEVEILVNSKSSLSRQQILLFEFGVPGSSLLNSHRRQQQQQQKSVPNTIWP